MKRRPPRLLLASALVALLWLAPTANAQPADDEPEPTSPSDAVDDGRIRIRDWLPPFHPAEWRSFGAGRGERGDWHDWNFGRRHENVSIYRHWPVQLIHRPMSPWTGMVEARAVGEVDLGAGHAGSPTRVGASLAYGLGGDDSGWSIAPWGVVLGVGRGLCRSAGDERCDRRLDQLNADVVYVVVSELAFEWLVKSGLALGPFEPAGFGFRAASAMKWLVRPFAVQVELFAQLPINQRDAVPLVTAAPLQLQLQLQRRLAMYLRSGYHGALLSGSNDVAIPAGAGLLLGARSIDVGAEWRFPRAWGTHPTLSDRILFVSAALRYW
jgi:hypothetical protein